MKPRCHKQQAMTIAEMLVVMSLFLLALGLVAILFSYANHTSQRQHERIDAEGKVLQASRLIAGAFSGGPRSGQLFYYQDDPDPRTDLVMATLSTRDAEGKRGWDPVVQQPLYQGYHAFYRVPAEDTLRTHYTAIAPNPVVVPPTVAALTGEMSGPTSKILAERVTAFQLRSMKDDSLQTVPSNPLNIYIRYELTDRTPLVSRFSVKCVL